MAETVADIGKRLVEDGRLNNDEQMAIKSMMIAAQMWPCEAPDCEGGEIPIRTVGSYRIMCPCGHCGGTGLEPHILLA